MTPVRNEAWVLRAFLAATSLWADYIIIADQMSTDGSREIYKEFQSAFTPSSASVSEHHCELIVIDNKNPEFNEAERQAMLVAKAREVASGRDTLLWGLDADEIIAANAFETEDWQRILNSKPGAVFWFNWAITSPDLMQYQLSTNQYPWCFHDDGVEPHGNYVRNMHSMRIPYPADEHDMTHVKDFYVHHLAWVNPYRVAAKRRFYTFIDWEMNHRSAITLARTYTITPDTTPFHPMTEDMVYTKGRNGFDMWSFVRTDEKHCWMDDYVVERLPRHSQRETARLMIWDREFLEEFKMKDPRGNLTKLFHGYLVKTKDYRQNKLIRIVDKILKRIVK